MDKKFLEEAGVILRKLSANVAFSDPKKRPISQEEIIAEHLSSLSSKHKEDVRALIAAIKSCEPPSEDGRAKSEKLALAGAGADVMKERVLIAVASTLKERGISL